MGTVTASLDVPTIWKMMGYVRICALIVMRMQLTVQITVILDAMLYQCSKMAIVILCARLKTVLLMQMTVELALQAVTHTCLGLVN